MKEACVGQWSLGTLVPVSARVDVSVYWMYGYTLRNVGKGAVEIEEKVFSIDGTPYHMINIPSRYI